MVDIIVPSNKINIVLDATLLTSLMTCARKTQFQHELHLQSLKGKSNSLETGSIVHKYLEVYYRSRMQNLSQTQAHGFGMAAAELYIQGCPYCTNYTGEGKPECLHEPDEYPGLTNTPSESEGYAIGWKFVLDTCQQYFDHYRSDFWVTLDVETVRSKVLYEDDEIRILWKSKLDWIVDTNNGIYPCDHKTMKQNRDQITLNNQFMGQCLMMDTRNIFINKIGFQKTLKPEDKFKRVSVSYSADRLIEWQSEILPYWCKQMVAWDRSGYMPPNFSNCDAKYGKCAFIEVCEADRGMREEVLRANFYVGREWNPTNQTNEE
jgi:hypothetical protein